MEGTTKEEGAGSCAHATISMLTSTLHLEHAGYIGIALNLGSLTAPLLGGVVFSKCGYDAVFAMILGVLVLDTLFRVMLRPEAEEQGNDSSLLATLETATAIEATNAEPVRRDLTEKTEDTTTTITSAEEARKTREDISEETSVPTESSSSPPSTNLTKTNTVSSRFHRFPAMIRLLFSARFITALWGVMVLAAIMSGFETVLPLHVNSTFHWTSLGSGLIFLPLSLPSLLGPLCGKLTDRYGGRYFISTSFAILSPTLILLRFVGHNSMNQKVLLCALLAIIGLCLAMILEPLFAEMGARAEGMGCEEEGRRRDDEKAGSRNSVAKTLSYHGQAYSYFNMAWALGDTVGPLLVGLVVDASGWSMAMLAMGLLCGVTAAMSLLWCEGWVFTAGKRKKSIKVADEV